MFSRRYRVVEIEIELCRIPKIVRRLWQALKLPVEHLRQGQCLQPESGDMYLWSWLRLDVQGATQFQARVTHYQHIDMPKKQHRKTACVALNRPGEAMCPEINLNFAPVSVSV